MTVAVRPERRRDRLVRTDLIPDAILAVAALATAGITADRWWEKNHPEWAIGVIVVGAVVTASQIWKVWRSHGKAAAADPEPELTQALLVLHTLLTEGTTAKPVPGASPRVCVFVPHRSDPERIVRLTDYIGPDGAAGGRDKTYPLRAGVVGAAFTTGQTAYDALTTDEPLTKFYVRKYHYTPEEAAGMRQDRRCWVAVPVVGASGGVEAVIFADASEPKFFGPKAQSPRRVLLEGAGLAVAARLGRP